MAYLSVAAQAFAQERAGVVTTLEGSVTVSRASLPAPAPLKFKDDIFVKDRIATGRDSVARILLGGRAVVTVREHSVVTITEVPGVSTVDVTAGRAAVAVAREKMRPGDLVEVRTPNAVAGIRGTVIVAEVFDNHRSAITVLKGVIDVTRADGGRATIVNALQRVIVAGQAPVSAPQKISLDDANRLRDEFRVAPPRATPTAAAEAVAQGEVDRTAKLFAGVAGVAAVAAPSVDRGGRGGAADDDQNVLSDPDGKNSGPGDRADKADKPEKADKPDKSIKVDKGSDALDKSGPGGNDKGAPKPVVSATPVVSGGGASIATPVASTTAPPSIVPAVSGLTDSGSKLSGKTKR